jgi:hypothetical protein
MPTPSGDQTSIETSAPAERDLIEAALAQTKGKVSGLSGAAQARPSFLYFGIENSISENQQIPV